MTEFNEFVRRELLPRTRTDYRMPSEVYAYTLEQVGVDMAPEELAAFVKQQLGAWSRGFRDAGINPE